RRDHDQARGGGARSDANHDDLLDPGRARGAGPLPEGGRDPRDDPRPARGAELAAGAPGWSSPGEAHRPSAEAHEVVSDREPCPFCEDTTHEVITTGYGNAPVIACEKCPRNIAATPLHVLVWVVHPSVVESLNELGGCQP